jgi:hypothetical protein
MESLGTHSSLAERTKAWHHRAMESLLHLNLTPLLQGFFFVLLFLFSVYGLFLGYHWFTFGTSRNTSTIALAVYLSGGAILFLSLASSIQLL